MNWIDIEKTRNKMISWKYSSSGDDYIKSKFVSVGYPSEKMVICISELFFLIKRHYLYFITILRSRTNVQINKESKFTSKSTDIYSSKYTSHA